MLLGTKPPTPGRPLQAVHHTERCSVTTRNRCLYAAPFTLCFPHETVTFLCPFKIHFNMAKGGRQHFVGSGWGVGTPVGGLDTHTHYLI